MLEELERLREVVGEEHGQVLAGLETAVRAHLAAAEERNERLRVLEEQAEESTRMAGSLEETRRRLESAEVGLHERDSLVGAQAGEIAGLKESLAATLEAYRKTTRAQVPSAAELIVGSSVEEIDASLERAQGVLAKVETELRERLATEKIPVGAPGRTGPDLSQMSPAEKIRYGLGARG
ncbi:MAG: hypothetical protein EPO21_11765 [Chloroflexota bacterium]|nr:MAG: hypothetical protein EPO21_11765 [Chloroflexota bacterium]